ncbi:MAG: esterase-like activity of phytase family protein [Steroidobacteraceae bacterium]
MKAKPTHILVNNLLAMSAVTLQLWTQSAHAEIELIARGQISGTYTDMASETATTLESSVVGNRLGGLGSGLAYAGGTTFLALPDRGPNATTYNTAVDNTTSFIPRFHTLTLNLAPSESDAALPFVLTPMLHDTTLLSSYLPLYYSNGAAYGLPSGVPALNALDRTYYFTGRSDNFDAGKNSLNSNNARLDPEGIRVSNDGDSIYITDEYGPYVYQFDRNSGRRTRVYKLPEIFAATKLSAVGDTEISGNTVGRVANKGMEGLAITPDGRYLLGAMQSPLLQDGGTSAPYTRLVKIDTYTGNVQQYAYELTNIGTAAKPKYGTISEVLAINNTDFLVDERDGKGLGDNSDAAFKKLFRISLNGATEVSSVIGSANLVGKAVSKTLFLDLVSTLSTYGYAAKDIPAKIEGIAFGQDVTVGTQTRHTLFIANDNDFLSTITDSNHAEGIDNPNQFFVFAFDDNELPGLVKQRIKTDSRGNDDDHHGRRQDNGWLLNWLFGR